MQFAPLSAEEFEQLDELLFHYANQGDENAIILNVSELDGFLTAILSSFEPVPPSEWLSVLFNQQTPDLNDERAETFMNLVSRHSHSIVESLQNDPKNYQPIFWEERVGRRKLVVVSPWCNGYVVGSMVANWQNLPDELQSHFDFIKAHIKLENTEEMLPLVEQRKIEKQLKQAAVAIFTEVNAQFATPTEKSQPFINANKVGANEPCPCGSGKKYKKCCK